MNFTIEKLPSIISEIAVKALLYEVSASPKPGLVDRLNNGAHKDMDFYTFIDSSVGLGKYFYKIAQVIQKQYEGALSRTDFVDSSLLLKDLQKLGIEAEALMFEETNHINTHKGAIYALGLISSAVCECLIVHPSSNIDRSTFIMSITDRISAYTKPVFKTQFPSKEQAHTYGETQYLELGLTGARGEAASGYLSARTWGLPILEASILKGLTFNDAMVQALLELMSHLEDSNVIGRHDYEMLLISKEKAKEVVNKGGMYTEDGRVAIMEYDKWCIEKNVSHGGCADLLAVSVYLKLLADKFCN